MFHGQEVEVMTHEDELSIDDITAGLIFGPEMTTKQLCCVFDGGDGTGSVANDSDSDDAQ